MANEELYKMMKQNLMIIEHRKKEEKTPYLFVPFLVSTLFRLLVTAKRLHSH
jgi:hypothetical protein